MEAHDRALLPFTQPYNLMMITIRNTCSIAKLAPIYLPLIRTALATYHSICASQLTSVRLLGSVARNEAIVGQSDIDFMGLLTDPPSTTLRAVLEEAAHRLGAAHSVVSKVDLDMVDGDQLSEFQRFVLTGDSLCLYGSDDVREGEQHLDRAHLAALVTPSATDLIHEYRAWAESLDPTGDPATLRRCVRVTSKDLLKCLRGIALIRGGDYEHSIARTYQQVVAKVPEQADLAAKLYAAYCNPALDRSELLGLLALAESAWDSVQQ